MDQQPESGLVFVDGTDALAFVIIRPGESEDSVSLEAAAAGLDHATCAQILRNVADQWDPPQTGDTGNTAPTEGR